jgi:hypothetical protein
MISFVGLLLRADQCEAAVLADWLMVGLLMTAPWKMFGG